MEGGLCDTDELQYVLERAKALGEPRVDIGHLVGMPGRGPVVEVSGVLEHVLKVGHPQVALHWDDKVVTISHVDGGVVATFELKF